MSCRRRDQPRPPLPQMSFDSSSTRSRESGSGGSSAGSGARRSARRRISRQPASGGSFSWIATGPLRCKLDRFPFVPDDPARLAQDCYEAFSIQVAGLARRLSAIGGDKAGGTKPVLGVSGGLDSTHALLVCARAMDLLGRDRSEILTYTMPGFATTEHTRSNAELLSRARKAEAE